jgi:Putative Flp pilus-assembly TadE/G-like
VLTLRRHARDERGVALVLFALLLPLILLVGVVVVDVGNWYVHAKRTQTLVDAAAFAGGTKFTQCTSNALLNGPANTAIRQEALRYAGDTTRDPATKNLQEQEQDDVHVVLNASNYWTTDPYPPDDTIASPGDPCSVKYLDVKGTDEWAPLLWGLIPYTVSPKRKARVQIERARSAEGILPWTVLDVDPIRVAAIFVDEEDGRVLRAEFLNQQTLPSGDPLARWNVWGGDFLDFDVTTQNIGVIILESKVANPALPDPGDLPPYECDQAPTRVRCHAGGTAESGLSFIHGYDDATGSANGPVVKDVYLTPDGCSPPGFGNNLSAPYFVFDGPCGVGIQAVLDFGNVADPPAAPPAGIRAQASANGGTLTWSPGGIGGALGTWSCSNCISLSADSGRTPVDIDWETQVGGGSTRQSGTLPKVAAPYMSNNASDPIEYVELTCASSTDVTCPSLSGNSLPDEAAGLTGPTIHVTVGFRPPIKMGQKVAFRVASPSGSKNQGLDCDKGRQFDEEILEGCFTPPALNYDQTTQTWRDLDCDDYDDTGSPTYRYSLPVDDPYLPDPLPDCVRIEPGDRLGLFRKGVHDRFESPCTANNWDPTLVNIPPDDDKRWIRLIVTDATAFEGAGASPDDSIPIKYIGSFYVAGWTTGGQANGCPGENEPPPPGWRARANSGDVWGYFRWTVLPSGGGTSTGELCNFDGTDTCIAVLVE